MAEVQEIIEFWFADGMQKRWFNATPALDQEIRERFEDTWQRASAGEFDSWLDSADGALALAIVLDQFPLNMFRGQARAFASEAKAIEIALAAVGRGLDRLLPGERVAFLYMPLMHSENLAHQQLSVRLFERAGLASNLRFARHHLELVQRFGRFPHRNAILGRSSTPQEMAYLASPQAFKG
ncbi:MAG: DUF924 domain-containing protein [Chromatiaceae bacterium]|jgi:uncharacterized protein (DUF924 family)|nr:DUF924 domain-containing protein [Chromatiaceae bacterium]